MGKVPVFPLQDPLYEADRVHPSVILSGFLMHCFYGVFAGTAVIRRNKRIVVSPWDVLVGFHCSRGF